MFVFVLPALREIVIADLMFTWMHDQIVEAWHHRKSSRTAGRRPLACSTADLGHSAGRNTMLRPGSPDIFNVNVISLEGHVSGIPVKHDFTIERIKKLAVKHFYGHDVTKPAEQFRLMHAAKLKQLVDEYSASDEEISEFDELLLVAIRSVPTEESFSDEELKAPNEEAIAQATCHLPVRNRPRPPPSADCPADFQNEIRKILITLVQASARILMHSPDAERFYDALNEKLKSRCKPNIDPKNAKILLGMGYSLKRVRMALQLRKSNITEALKWLIDHEDDVDDDDENDDMDEGSIQQAEEAEQEQNAGESSANTRTRSLRETCIDLYKEENHSPKNEENLVTIVDRLLESFRYYKKMDFKPNRQAMQSLIEMGFEKRNVIGALKITGNDQANACAWLLGERSGSLQDLDDGLDPEGPIYKAIMTNPHIQLSLTNPKMLLAYLSILETPTSTNVWINDPEVSPFLSLIFKTYHAEKHAIHMNRYTIN